MSKINLNEYFLSEGSPTKFYIEDSYFTIAKGIPIKDKTINLNFIMDNWLTVYRKFWVNMTTAKCILAVRTKSSYIYSNICITKLLTFEEDILKKYIGGICSRPNKKFVAVKIGNIYKLEEISG